MLGSTILLGGLFSVASALTIPSEALHERAGGPAFVPLTPNCTAAQFLYTTLDGTTFQPKAEVKAESLTYQAYYGNGVYDREKETRGCVEQCNSWYPKECTSAFWAEDLVIPKGYYGTPGGSLSTGCLFFKRPLMAEDFEVAPEGQAERFYAANIECTS